MSNVEDEVWVPIVTNAPKNYDYGWTRPICDNYATCDLRDKTLRSVETLSQQRAEGQMMRYGSGLYFTMPKAQFDGEVSQFPDRYRLTYTKVEYRHHDFDFTLVPDWDEGVAELLKTVQAAKKMDDVVSLEAKSGGLIYELVVNATPERLAIVVKFIEDAYNKAAQMNESQVQSD